MDLVKGPSSIRLSILKQLAPPAVIDTPIKLGILGWWIKDREITIDMTKIGGKQVNRLLFRVHFDLNIPDKYRAVFLAGLSDPGQISCTLIALRLSNDARKSPLAPHALLSEIAEYLTTSAHLGKWTIGAKFVGQDADGIMLDEPELWADVRLTVDIDQVAIDLSEKPEDLLSALFEPDGPASQVYQRFLGYIRGASKEYPMPPEVSDALFRGTK